MKPHSVKFIIKETNINFYSWRLIDEGFLSPIVKKYCGDKLYGAVMKIEKDNGSWGPNMKNWFTLGRNLVSRIEKNKTPLNKLLDEHLKNGTKVLQLSNEIIKEDLSQVVNYKFVKFFKKTWKLVLYLNAIGFIPVVSDFEHSLLTQKLIGILKTKGIGDDKVQDYLSVLISFSKPTLYWEEKLNLLKICLQYKSLKRIKASRELQQHIKKYFWLNYGYQGPVWRKSDFIKRVKEILGNKKTVQKQYIEHKNNFKLLKNKQLTINKRLRLNKEEARLFSAARLFMFLKAYRTEVRHRFYYVSDEIFKELSRRFSLPVVEFRYALRDEILKILEGKKVNHREIIARRNLMVLVSEAGRSKFVPKNKIKEFLKEALITEEVKDTEVIHGQIAFFGRVQGTVKIVNSIADVKKVKEGDILISFSTTPDLLPAMTKAAAFVTDVGGITSHAAIVAREMKKPCVIGTKIATRVLKDGDLVEVDATKGIIKKL